MQVKFFPVFSFLIIIGVVYLSFTSQTPKYQSDINISETEFSVDRALEHLKIISQKPHYVGTEAHTEVRNYIQSALEQMGLSVEIQKQEGVNSKWKGAALTYNIICKIEGSNPDAPALLLLSHYDSSPHSSLGASDAGTGVVAILESVRAYLASGEKPKNDLIILISDAEELGLLGAQAFVSNHPWAKKVKLVLNLEARGSGGPSYMLLETNGGNEHYIKSFSRAKLTHPVGNSLMYSIYKMLPNDTDLTVFREIGDIDGFNFAFIDDHFDYHTVQDSYERADRNSLKHQGEYMFSLMNYYASLDLTNLKSNRDDVFFNVPFLGMQHYPFAWAIPLFAMTFLAFTGLYILALRKKRVSVSQSLKGSIPLLKSFFISGLIGFFGWKLVLKIVPAHQDILHGFTYNGKWYLIAFVSFSLWLFWEFYSPFFKKKVLPDLLVAPILLWMVINFLIATKLPGASFFILPLIGLVLAFALLVLLPKIDTKQAWWFVLFALPGLSVLAPMVEMFPVGLGLKMIAISMVLTILLASTLLSVFDFYKNHTAIIKLFMLLTILSFVSAFSHRQYSEENRAPNSIVFIQDVDQNEAYWASYDRKIDSYTQQVLGENPTDELPNISFGSKYNTPFRWINATETKPLMPPSILSSVNDSIAENYKYDYVIRTNRNANVFYINTLDSLPIQKISFNGAALKRPDSVSENDVWHLKGHIISYYLAKGVDSLALSITVKKNAKPNLELYEISMDLLDNKAFSLSPRSPEMMPKAFVINDAVILKKQF